MIGTRVVFALEDEVKHNALKKHLVHLVEQYKKVPGPREKFFFMNPDNLDQGAFLVWHSRESFGTYLESGLYKAAVTEIAKGEPDIEIYIITASLTDGMVL